METISLPIVILFEPTQRGIPVMYTAFPQKVHGAFTTSYLWVERAHSVSRQKQSLVSPLRAHLPFLASYFKGILSVRLRCSGNVCWLLPLCLESAGRSLSESANLQRSAKCLAVLHVLRWGYFSLKKCFGGESKPWTRTHGLILEIPHWKASAGPGTTLLL